MRRRCYFLGLLCGLVSGVFAAFLSISVQQNSMMNVSPPMQAPAGATVLTLPGQGLTPAPVPPDWQTLYFNGRPYYLIPLAAGTSS